MVLCRKDWRSGSLAVAAGLVATSCFGFPAVAQDALPPALAQMPQAVSFDIPAQPLTSAVTAFGRQSGFQVSVDQGTLANLQSNAVAGSMAPEEALRRLLEGTGVTWRFSGGRSVFLTKVADNRTGTFQLDPVQVQGVQVPSQAMIGNLPPPYAGGQVATGGQLGLLGNRDVMDTPFNQTNFTAKRAQDQQATTVKDVLIDDPSIRWMRGDSSGSGDDIWIRGFFGGGQEGTSYNGLFGILPTYSIMAELAERVEVLKGPSAMLNGMTLSGVGGTINVVPKRAPDQGITQLTGNYVSAGQFGGHADVARRFGPDNQFGVRFNGVFRAGQSDIQYNSDQRTLAVLGLDFRGERVRLSADLGYQYQYIGGVVPYLGLANGVPLPWAPNVRSNPGGQPWNESGRKDFFGVVRGEIDLTERITAYAAVGAHDNRFDGLYSLSATITNADGTATAGAPANVAFYRTYLSAEAGVRALVDTGPIGHELTFTAAIMSRENGGNGNSTAAFASNIYNPTIIARPNIAAPDVTKTGANGLSSLGFADTLSAAEKRIQLTVGGRLQRVEATNFNVTTGQQTSRYDESAFSPAVALIVKPWRNVSIYGNWIQGLQQGAIVGNTFRNAGELFPPYKSTQYEAGVKVDWGRFSTTASVFQISQPSLVTDVATNTQLLGGEQRNQGLEFNVFGEPVEGVRLLGGFMLLNAVLAKTAGGTADGWVAPFSPAFSFNLAGEWDVPFARGLTLTGRAVYTGSQYIDSTWPRRSLPEWTRFDLGVRYAFDNPAVRGKQLVARFNVDNVLDANYWAGGTGVTQLFLGAPRTFRMSLTADF